MTLDLLAMTIGTSVLLIASWHDLRTREVPDLLSLGLLIFAIAYGCMKSLLLANWTPVAQMLLGLGLMIVIGTAMYLFGQWGGADAKLLMALGALIGLGLGSWDSALYLLLALFAGALYGLSYTAYLALRHRKAFINRFKTLIRESGIHRIRLMTVALCFLFLLGAIFSPAFRPFLISLGIIAYLFFYLWITVKIVEESILTRQYRLSELRDGDWIKEAVWAPRTGTTLAADLKERAKERLETVLEEDLPLHIYRSACFTGWAERRKARIITRCSEEAERTRVFRGLLGWRRFTLSRQRNAELEKLFTRLLTAKTQRAFSDAAKALSEALGRPIEATLRSEHQYAFAEEYLCGPADLGITQRQISRLKKTAMKNVIVKEGIPFIPAFLLALLLFWAFYPQLSSLLAML